MTVRRVIVREPSPRLDHGIVTHIDRAPVDVDRARQQWTAYVDTLRLAGWHPIVAPPLDDAPDGVFVEDVLVMFGSVAALTSPGAYERRVEIESIDAVVSGIGFETATIDPGSCLDGGDVLAVGRTVFVGRSGRTDDGGIDQLRSIVEPLGYRVVPVAVRGVLHLKSAVTALPDGTIIGHPEVVDDVTAFGSFLPVPEPEGSHVVVLGEREIMISASAPRTAELLRRRGLGVVEVEIDEFEKREGCVTCLSVQLGS